MCLSKKVFRVLLSFLTIVSLTLSFAPTASFAKDVKEVDYLALGDSLAAGQTPYGEISDGYTDFLAEKMDEIKFLDSFSKSYAVPGYTTADVWSDIEKNVKRDDSIAIQNSIKNAEIITLDAGANDLLKLVHISDTGVSVEVEKVTETLSNINSNLKKILAKIKKLNPKVQVYVMGYYNPFPYLPETEQEQLLPLLKNLNNTINEAASKQRAVFVSTADAIGEDFRTYLPNPKNIHLSEEGYQVIADLFWMEMSKDFPISKLSVNHKKLSLKIGDEVQLSLSATYNSGVTENVTDLATWSSTNKRVVTVENGLIIAKGKGSASIKAKYAGRTVTVSIRVK